MVHNENETWYVPVLHTILYSTNGAWYNWRDAV